MFETRTNKIKAELKDDGGLEDSITVNPENVHDAIRAELILGSCSSEVRDAPIINPKLPDEDIEELKISAEGVLLASNALKSLQYSPDRLKEETLVHPELSLEGYAKAKRVAKLPECNAEPSKKAGKFLAVMSELRKINAIFGKIGDQLYLYDSKKGCYAKLDRRGAGGLTELMINKLGENWLTFLEDKVVDKIYQYILEKEGTALDLTAREVLRKDFVNMRNGVLDLKTLQLTPHDSRYGFTFQIDAKFKKPAKHVLNGASQGFFKNLSGDDEHAYKALFQALGYAISNDRDQQLAVFIIGSPANGKSTLLTFLEKLIPEEAFTAFAIEDFSDKFAAACLENVHFSICSDLEEGAMSKKQCGVFKRLIAGDTISCRAIYGNFHKIKPRAAMLFAANRFPFLVSDPGVKRRIWLIKTGPTVPYELRDDTLGDQLFADRNTIVSMALTEFSKARNDRSKLCLAEIDADDYDVDSLEPKELVALWADSCLKADAGASKLPLQEAFESFQEYCHAKSLDCAITNATFGKFVKEKLGAAHLHKDKCRQNIVGFRFNCNDSFAEDNLNERRYDHNEEDRYYNIKSPFIDIIPYR